MATDTILLKNRSSDYKVQITPAQQKTLTHLPQRPKVDLAFSNLKYTVKQGKVEKTILKSVSGRLRSGELTAIMGPSGAGKSTLLNILTGFRTDGVQGQILMNENERDLSQFRKLSAYIMQDNQLHLNLTVDEAMNVAAKLKIGDKSKSERADIITEILDTLGLLDHRKTMTSGLSGGQKKRLSIALELVSNPPIMFFDEPTSGLDSSSCFQCISLLKTLARGGRTIICTIHQPSARLFEMFDHLYTLADGQCVYQGSTKQLVPFLASLGLQCPSYHNPASYIIEVACGEYGDHTRKLVDAIDNGKNDIREGKPFPEVKYNNGLNNSAVITNDISKNFTNFATENKNLMVNNVAKENLPPPPPIGFEKVAVEKVSVDTALLENSIPVRQPRYGNSQIQQFFIILGRAFLFSRRDWTLMYLRLFAHILVGFLIGALYFKIGNDGAKVLSNLGFLFFNMLFLMYTSMTITILSFPLEMPVLLKEHFNRWYSLRSYYLAITVSDIPFQTVFCVLYVTIVYFMTSQPHELSRYLMFLAACLLVSFVAQSVGLVVGAAMNVQGPRHYTATEKKIFLEILKDHDVVENKKTDSASLKLKEQAWKLITDKYNSSRDVCEERTVTQLKKLWSNIKHQQREALTREKQSRMGTGGGPESPQIELDADVAAIAPHLMTTAPVLFTSNMTDEELIVRSKDVADNIRTLTAVIPEIEVVDGEHQEGKTNTYSSKTKKLSNDKEKRHIIEQNIYDKKRRIEEVTKMEIKLVETRIAAERKLAEMKYEREKELYEMKKKHLIEMHNWGLAEAEAKAKLAELILDKHKKLN